MEGTGWEDEEARGRVGSDSKLIQLQTDDDDGQHANFLILTRGLP